MRFLRSNTATRITVGPFLDKTDGITPEVALTVTSEKLTLMVDTGGVPTLVLDVAPTASGGANDMVHITGDDAGFYDLELAAANVNYVGRATLAITDAATHCPVYHEFMILPANVYDSLDGTDLLQVDVTQVAGDARGAVIVSGTAAAIANGSITLASGQGTTLAGVESLMIVLTGGTNAIGKSRYIAHDTGDVFTVDPAWNAGETLPSGTITYVVVPAPPSPTSTIPKVDLDKIAGTTVDTAQAQLGVNVVTVAAAAATTISDEVRTTAMTEAYAADGAAPTIEQALFAIQQFLQEKAISGTTMTVNKLDGTTAAMTFTLNDSVTPTSITRAT